jgi:hypothetical protein
MRTRPLAGAVAALAAATAAGCYHRVDPPAPPPAPPAAPAGDPGWPASLELTMVDKSDVIKHAGLAMFSVETRVPVFRSDPPAIAAALNARIARLARPDVDPRTHEGSYSLECSVRVANRFAVILDCTQLLEEHTHEEAEQGTGTSPDGPRPLAFGWWLRRGLPELSVEQFAPRFDLRAAIDAAAAAAPAGCDLRACEPDPKSFVLDGDGITLIPTTFCGPACDGALPTIPLDEIKPSHAWASELVTRIRRRFEAGNELVEGERHR